LSWKNGDGGFSPLSLLVVPKGATREWAKGAEAPPLANSKLRKKDKIWDKFDLFCVAVF